MCIEKARDVEKRLPADRKTRARQTLGDFAAVKKCDLTTKQWAAPMDQVVILLDARGVFLAHGQFPSLPA
jgi:hypothetical protein